MRRPTLIVFVVVFTLFWIVFVSRLLAFIQLFFEHSGTAITQAELAVAHNATSPDPRPQLIPKIIHQVFHDWRNVGMPKDWEEVRKTCIEKNKDWEHKLWTEQLSRDFIKEHYPWFLKTYDGYQYPVQRIDTVRYFLLLHYGGIYLDLDNGCLEDLQPLLYVPTFTTDGGRGALSNNILASVPNHPFWNLLTSSLIPYNYNYFFPYVTISYASGQWFFTSVWQEYHRSRVVLEYQTARATEKAKTAASKMDYAPSSGGVGFNGRRLHRIMMDDRPGTEPWIFFTQERGGTWVNWDNYFFLWIGEHLVLLGVLVLGGVAVVAWAVMKYVRRYSRTRGGRGAYEVTVGKTAD